MIDETENYRRARQAELNATWGSLRELEKKHGEVWTSLELGTHFEVIGFMAPFVVVKRRKDGKKGSLEFQHSPRFYFNWQED